MQTIWNQILIKRTLDIRSPWDSVPRRKLNDYALEVVGCGSTTPTSRRKW